MNADTVQLFIFDDAERFFPGVLDEEARKRTHTDLEILEIRQN
jgi:hypothetical protein